MSNKNTVIAQAEQRLLTVAQAADFLGVNPGTIRRWAQTSHLSGVKVGIRGDWRFTREALMAVVQEGPGRMAHQSTPTGHASSVRSEHLVQFYEDDSFLIKKLSSYVRDSLLAEEVCVLIATRDHIDQLNRKLALQNMIDVDAAKRTGHLAMYDAEETLDKFVIDGHLDDALFEQVIGGVIRGMVAYDRPVKAYGEMVAILWQRGDHAIAVELEKAWNALATRYDFILMCAYPMGAFNKNDHSELFEEISASHTHVIPTESYVSLKDEKEHLRTIAVLQQKAMSLEDEIAERKELAKLNVAKDEFISIASHQLRTPATGVKQYLGMLIEGFHGELNPEQHRSLEKAYASNERQLKIINDLLLVARINAGDINMNPMIDNLKAIITDVVEEQRAVFEAKHQVLEVEVTGELLAKFDPLYIRMVIENLVSNASKYSPQNTVVHVRAQKTGSHIVVSVHDQGIGIAPTDHAKLFHKFSRIYNKQSVEGNGLGLYWSKKIVDLHGGELSLRSRLGHGSTFTITLPLTQPES